MKVLAINGSPTPKQQSITEVVLSQFLEGARSADADIQLAHLSDKRVLPCDCGHLFACWVKTPGRCTHHEEDDVREILDHLAEADVVVFATPLYVESMTGQMKTLLDRTVPLVQPYLELSEAESRHPLRELREGMRFVLVSTCGHYEISQFSALVHTFERVARNLHGELIAKILRPHAMLLRNPDRLGDSYEIIMGALRDAGRQVVLKGTVDETTEKQIQMELTPKKSFIQQANSMWDRAIERQEFR